METRAGGGREGRGREAAATARDAYRASLGGRDSSLARPGLAGLHAVGSQQLETGSGAPCIVSRDRGLTSPGLGLGQARAGHNSVGETSAVFWPFEGQRKGGAEAFQ